MAASHYAYNTLKVPRLVCIISIPSDKKDTIICLDKMYREAVATEAAEIVTATKDTKKKKGAGVDTGKDSGKHVSPECAAPVEELSECSTGKRYKVAPPAVKKVPARLDGSDGTFTISSTLNSK
jgi:hypothetical protein